MATLGGDENDHAYNPAWQTSGHNATTAKNAVITLITVTQGRMLYRADDRDRKYNPTFVASGKSAADSTVLTQDQNLVGVREGGY